MARRMDRMGGDLRRSAEDIERGINQRIPRLVGEMLVDEFRESFDMQRFNDYASEKWKNVKRRTYGSQWYGFSLGANGRVPTGSRGYRANGKVRRYGTRGGKTNFSQSATTRAILRGSGSINLQESIYVYSANRARIIVATDQPHAEIHNEGGRAKIFGRKEFTMPKRQFMGHSRKSDDQAEKIMNKYFNTVIK